MNVVSVKNGEPERQTAKDCYRIRETGLSSSGRSRQDDALMEAPRAHTADFFPVVILQGKHSRECRFYQKCRASVGWLACTASLFCGACRILSKKDFAPLPPGSRPKATGSNPAPQPERKSPYDGCRKGFFVLSSFPSCGKALCSATAFRLPPQALPQLQHEARPGIARCVLFIVKDGPDGQILLETETFL